MMLVARCLTTFLNRTYAAVCTASGGGMAVTGCERRQPVACFKAQVAVGTVGLWTEIRTLNRHVKSSTFGQDIKEQNTRS